ncbi:hypothetical protein [Plantactinospora sp. CA-290183]|uniref:hypothetical protein n=1 Tax=Plantactinospora sp. CA-290183 TaxID=3240006 RepID=UPI003D8D1208
MDLGAQPGQTPDDPAGPTPTALGAQTGQLYRPPPPAQTPNDPTEPTPTAPDAQPGQLYRSAPPLQHLPQRPTWLCRTCAVDWPCLTARSLLTIEYANDPTALHIYLATMLYDAIDDLHRLHPNPGPDPAGLHARFLGWAGERRPRGDAGHRNG